MDVDNLIHMANRIGQFFEAMPDRQEAMDGIAQHLKKFWEPRMREELLTQLDRSGPGELSPLVAEAIRSRRALIEPHPAAQPAR